MPYVYTCTVFYINWGGGGGCKHFCFFLEEGGHVRFAVDRGRGHVDIEKEQV